MWIYNFDEKQLVEDPSLDTGGESGAASPSSGSASNVGAANAQNAGAPTSSGQFTDIGKYLAVNQDQAGATGQKVATNVENQLNTAQQGTADIQKQFDESIGKAGPALSSEEIKGAAGNVSQFAGNQANVDKFKQTLGGQYGGPESVNDLTGYDDLLKSFQSVNKIGEQVESSGGRQELIKGAYDRPERAKQGMLELDEALIRQTPEAIAPIRAQAQRAPEIQKQFDAFSQNATSKIGDTRQAVQDRSKEAREAFLGDQGVYNTAKQNLDSRVNAASQGVTQGADLSRNLLNVDWLVQNGLLSADPRKSNYNREGGYTPSQHSPTANEGNFWKQAFDPQTSKMRPEYENALNQMGINSGQYLDILRNYAPTKGLNPDNILSNFDPYVNYGTPASANITRDTVANEQDYATMQALEQLLGGELGGQRFVGNDASQAGKYNQDIVDFNYQALMDKLRNPTKLTPKVTTSGGLL